MDVEEMMIDYVMNQASSEEIREFFGYADYGVLSVETCMDNLSQMPDDVLDELVKKFNLPQDGVKL